MKTIKLVILFTIITLSQLFAQITSIVKEENGPYVKYWTQSKEAYHNLYKSQSKEIKDRVAKEIKIIDGSTGNDLDVCFSTIRLNNLADMGGGIMPVLYFDQTGKVYAAGLLMNKRYITLTDAEAQCLLTKILAKKLQLTFQNGFFNFYNKVTGEYRPTRRFVNPHDDELPDLDDGQY